jgi:DNA-binding transcriptional ArsR family regulator
LKILVSTYGHGDLGKTLMAMRHLPYDRLVLLCEAGGDDPEGLEELRSLESMAGHEVDVECVDTSDFMELVEGISQAVTGLSRSAGVQNEVVLNISGGNKLLADAALFAAFRLGLPTYHVTERMVKLPVMKGVTARSRFTALQSRFIFLLDGPRTIAEIVELTGTQSKQSVERVMRELRGMGLVCARLESGQVVASLSEDGREVRKALVASNGREDT